jgi:hypothetical protein
LASQPTKYPAFQAFVQLSFPGCACLRARRPNKQASTRPFLPLNEANLRKRARLGPVRHRGLNAEARIAEVSVLPIVKVHARRSACRGSGWWQSGQAHGGKNLLNGGLRFDKRDRAEVAFAVCAFQFGVKSSAQKFAPRDVFGFAFYRRRCIWRCFFILCVAVTISQSKGISREASGQDPTWPEIWLL